jgi:hypothetical protein
MQRKMSSSSSRTVDGMVVMLSAVRCLGLVGVAARFRLRPCCGLGIDCAFCALLFVFVSELLLSEGVVGLRCRGEERVVSSESVNRSTNG